MTRLDEKLVPKALALIERYGVEAIFYIRDQADYNVVTGQTVEAGQTQFPRKISPPSPFTEKLWNGDTIFEGDMTALVAGSNLPFELSIDMQIQLQNFKWTLVGFDPIMSGEQVAVYQLHLRK